MPRRSRIALPGVAWHIIQRGNNRSACFYAPQDYRRYLDTLRDQANEHGCRIHAYVLMTNHVHLLLTPERADSASLMMKHLGQRYVQYVNRTYRRTGTLWEGRFRSCLTQDDRYVLACHRYIELNPVRAGMVLHPADYPWSSYLANAEGSDDPLLTEHPRYLALGSSPESRRSAYRGLFRQQMEPELIDEIRGATNGNFVLGNPRFCAQIEQMIGRRATPGKNGRPRKNSV